VALLERGAEGGRVVEGTTEDEGGGVVVGLAGLRHVREAAPEAHDALVAQLDGAGDEPGPVGGQAALAVQAGVDREVHQGLVAGARGPGGGGEGLELLEGRDAEVDAQPHRGVPVLVGAELPGEERRLVADALAAQAVGRLGLDGAEPADPRRERLGHHHVDAERVRVGLDDREHLDRGHALDQRGEVGAVGGEVDRRAAQVAGRGAQVGGHA
jgi:hypothetical protein